jgi:hypothetical protein
MWKIVHLCCVAQRGVAAVIRACGGSLEVNGKGFCVTSALRHKIYVDRRFGTTYRPKVTSIGCPETSVMNYR